MAKFLDKMNGTRDLKSLKINDLPVLAEEIREELIRVVAKTGGHIAASLGSVDFTVALHYVFNSPKDKIVWDVGHQSYAHKILTGRRAEFDTLRQSEGLSGFPNRAESDHDHFTVGHASTAISQALGLAVARDLKRDSEKIVAVVGDGSLTGGLSYEALNNAGHMRKDMLVVLNDNEMSISKNVGAMSHYLNRIISAPIYNRVRKQVERSLGSFPRLKRLVKHAEEGFKNLIVPGIIFEELGFRYFGPIDGHDTKLLVRTLRNIVNINGPKFLHLLTKKGKGFELAEKNPEKFHGVQPFEVSARNGKVQPAAKRDSKGSCYTDVFADSVLKLAQSDERVVAITAAMPNGTGLAKFAKKYPKRFFDVGIAEAHAVTFSGSLATQGLKPVCAIYSSFMQRAYDQMLHDVSLQGVNALFCLDRAGIVGQDGPTHHGVFDIAYLSSVPGSVVSSPWTSSEMRRMLELGIGYKGIFGIRYPKAAVPDGVEGVRSDFNIGEGEVLRLGRDVAILSIGNTVSTALEVSHMLQTDDVEAAVLNLRFAKPLDEALLKEWASKVRTFYTIEEHVLQGGFGANILEFLEREGLSDKVRLKRFALPNNFIEHGAREDLLEKYGLTSRRITLEILKEFGLCKDKQLEKLVL